MDNHTNFIGKIVGINFNTATIQPLIMYKVYGEKAQRTAEVTISQSELKTGDTVYCGVCERDITEARNGNMALSNTGRHHSLSDSVVIMGVSAVEYVWGDYIWRVLL